jgi:hypothetical protein
VAAVGAETLAVVGEPDGGGVVLRAGEKEVPVPVVLQECQRPFMAFHQNRPHRFQAEFQGGEKSRNRNENTELGFQEWGLGLSNLEKTRGKEREDVGLRLWGLGFCVC